MGVAFLEFLFINILFRRPSGRPNEYTQKH